MVSSLIVWLLSLAWAAASYGILRFNVKREFDRDEPLPRWLAVLVVVATACASLTLPAPWNATVAFAIGGFAIASWGDWTAQILWDEIIVGTIVCIMFSLYGNGASLESLEGGAVCGAFMFAAYYAALFCGRETGFGDVKLAAGIGFALGPLAGLVAIALGAAGWLLIVMAWARLRKVSLATMRRTPIPFGPGLTLGLVAGACTIPLIGSLRSW